MGGKTEGGWGGNTVWKKRTPVLRPVSDNVILEESWGISPRVDESVLDMYFTNHHFSDGDSLLQNAYPCQYLHKTANSGTNFQKKRNTPF